MAQNYLNRLKGVATPQKKMKKRAYLLWKTYFINLDFKRFNKAVQGNETFGERASHARRTARKKP